MEHLHPHHHDDQPNAQRESDLFRAHRESPGRRIFERDGETYEEVSFLHEPMEQYLNDITLLDVVLEHKKRALEDVKEILSARHAASDISSLHLLEGDISERIAYLKREIERFEITRTMTLQRLTLVARQDKIEKGMLDDLATDVEH